MNVAQSPRIDPDAGPMIQRRALSKTLHLPDHMVTRPNLVVGCRICRAQRKVSHQAQNVKTTVTNVDKAPSVDPDAEPVSQCRAMSKTLTPPSTRGSEAQSGAWVE